MATPPHPRPGTPSSGVMRPGQCVKPRRESLPLETPFWGLSRHRCSSHTMDPGPLFPQGSAGPKRGTTGQRGTLTPDCLGTGTDPPTDRARKGSPAQHSVLSPSTTAQSVPGGAGNPLRLLQGSTAQSEAPQPAAARGASKSPHSCNQEDQALTSDPEPAFMFF